LGHSTYGPLRWHWIETGVKLSGEKPKRRGFGTELIERTLAYDLGGEASLAFGVDGLNCTINLSADDQLMLTQSRRRVRKS
jgi:two-component system CheB/CheR fusion protein